MAVYSVDDLRKRIIQYADEIGETISRFSLTQDSFTEDFVARKALA